jgi:hypothetical protein
LAKLDPKKKKKNYPLPVSFISTGDLAGLEEKKRDIANGEIYKSTRGAGHGRSKTLPSSNAEPCQTIHCIKFLQEKN